MTAAFVAGLLAGYGIALPVGAVATYLVALTARTSLRIGAAAALGVATADGLYALAAVIGGWTLVTVIKPVAGPLRVASGLVLLAVAVLASIGVGKEDLAREAEGLDAHALSVAIRLNMLRG